MSLDGLGNASKMDGMSILNDSGAAPPSDPLLAISPDIYIDASLSQRWQDVSRSTAANADDDLVRVIDDLSGNGNHCVSPSDGTRWTLKLAIQNSLPVLRSGGTQYGGWGDLAAFDFGTGNFSVFILLKASSGGPFLEKDVHAVGGDNGIFLYRSSGGLDSYWNGSGDNIFAVGNANYNLYSAVRSGTGSGQLSIYYNGGSATTGTDGRNLANTKNAHLFADHAAVNILTGDFCFCLVVGRAVTNDELALVRSTISTRWGLGF